MLRIALRSACLRRAPILGAIPARFVSNTSRRSQGTETHIVDEPVAVKKEGILGKLQSKLGLSGNSQTRLRFSSFILYESIVDQLNYLEFFKKYDLPNTFNSWFLVTELHVWMILVRAMAEGPEKGENGRFLRNCIVEAMWGDVNARAKKLNPSNPAVTRKQIEMYSQQFQAALINYDEGLMGDDRVLAGALWRRFFEKECPSYEMLESLVKYVREHVKMLDGLPNENFVQKPQIKWKEYTLDKS